jgi:carboxyl-terminal processing protease
VPRIKKVRWRVESNDIGYVRIEQFTKTTADGVRRAMASLSAEVPPKALNGYILDLRNNPGGYIDQAVETVNAFVSNGEIVATKGRELGASSVVFARPARDLSQGKPLVVLVNGVTASAAEIASGALQDLKRALLIGTRTFGKGSMQSTFPLGDGALRLTTALCFTPSGRSIQASGVDPDIEILEVAPDGAEEERHGEALLQNHLHNQACERAASHVYVPADPSKDRQLAAAIKFLHGVPRAPREAGLQ